MNAPWYLTAEALSAIRACIASPPRKVEIPAPMELWLRGIETIVEYDDWTDDNADLLRRLENAAYQAAGMATREFDAAWIGTQDVLRFVLDGEGNVPGLSEALAGERKAAA